MKIEAIVATMPKKKLDLFKNLVSVGIILTIVYAVFVIVTLDSPMQFFNHSAFLICALSFISLGFVWKILNGSQLTVPNQSQQQQIQQSKTYQQPKRSTPRGSWQCPRCKSWVIGNQCPTCGTRR